MKLISFSAIMASSSQSSSSSSKIASVPFAVSGPAFGFEGMCLLINDKFASAEMLFKKHLHKYVQMRAGNFFVHYLNGVMSFEDDKIEEAATILKQMANLCSNDLSHLKHYKATLVPAVYGMGPMTKREIELENHIAIADSQVCLAMLLFIRQDVSSYIKGGWILRKAWKLYDKLYREVKLLYDLYVPQQSQGLPSVASITFAETIPSSDDSVSSVRDSARSSLSSRGSRSTIDISTSGSAIEKSRSRRSQSLEPRTSSALSIETIERLMAAVSFGYGSLLLGMSFLPPNLIKIIHFLGFHGNRNAGLDALKFSARSSDMRAPLAMLELLWFHTIIRPYFGLDGNRVAAGARIAQQLIESADTRYSSGPLFAFFIGRIHRLKGNMVEAITNYKNVAKITQQPDVLLLCLHELGWCYFMVFQWDNSRKAFIRLKKESKWVRSFYGYLIAISLGAEGKIVESKTEFQGIPRLFHQSHNQVEHFVLNRYRRVIRERLWSKEIFHMYCMELLYLWQTFPSCLPTIHVEMLAVLGKVSSDQHLPLRYLLEGAVYACQNQFSVAVECLKLCLQLSKKIDEQHIPANASYELAMIYLQDPKTVSAGLSLLQHAKEKYSNYFFDNRLGVRFHHAITNKKLQTAQSQE